MSTITSKQGTAITWKTSGGDEVLTLTSLASAAARQGDKTDLGALFGRRYGYRLLTKWAVAPTANTLLRIGLAFSEDDTTFAGGVGASDAAYSDLDDFKQLMEVVPIVADADTNAQCVVGTFVPLARYMVPVFYNDATGQALSGTAGDHVFVIWPINDDIT